MIDNHEFNLRLLRGLHDLFSRRFRREFEPLDPVRPLERPHPKSDQRDEEGGIEDQHD